MSVKDSRRQGAYRQSGFTVPELIIAIVLLAGLLVGVAFLIHPDNQDMAKDNAQRRIDLASIARGLHAYQHAHTGALPDGILDQAAVIGSEDGELDICTDIVPAYMKDLPLDPAGGAKATQAQDASTTSAGSSATATTPGSVTPNNDGQPCNAPNMRYSTGYTIAKKADGGFTLAAPLAADGAKISLDFPAVK